MPETIDQTLDYTLKKLFQDGKLVQVNVSQWGMTYALNETDLKLAPETDAVPGFASLGKKNLMPDDIRLQFKRVESQARAYLHNNSRKFPINDAHFVPRDKLVEVLLQLDVFNVTFNTAADEFVLNYEANKQKMLDMYPAHRSSLEPCFPAVASLRQKFDFKVRTFEVALPTELKEVSLADIREENIADAAIREKYAELVKQKVVEREEELNKFVRTSISDARKEIMKTFQAIADKINRKEIVSQTNIKSIRATIDSFDGLNWLDDKEMSDRLAVVKQMAHPALDFREDSKSVANLQLAINGALTIAEKISDIDKVTGQYFRRIEL